MNNPSNYCPTCCKFVSVEFDENIDNDNIDSIEGIVNANKSFDIRLKITVYKKCKLCGESIQVKTISFYNTFSQDEFENYRD